MTQTDNHDSRTYLLNIAAGGDGHTGAWIERVTYEATEDTPAGEVYLLHSPPTQNSGTRVECCGTLDYCRRVYGILSGATAGEADSTPYTDSGRRVPPQQQTIRRNEVKIYPPRMANHKTI